MFDANIGKILYCKDGGTYRFFKVLDEAVKTLTVLEVEALRDHEYYRPTERFMNKEPQRLVQKTVSGVKYYKSSLGENSMYSFYFYEGVPFYVKF